MKFKVSEDVDAPVDLVWARCTDFSGVERELAGQGVEIARVGQWQTPTKGAEWRGTTQVRARVRQISSTVTEWTPTEFLEVQSQIGGMAAVYELTFLSLRPDMTRVQAVLNLSANTLSARLSLQTIKLIRGRVILRLQGLLARQGNQAEDDYRRAVHS